MRRWWAAIVLAALWEAGARMAGQAYYPPPSGIVVAAWELWFSGPPARLFLTDQALEDFVPSLAHLLSGWAIAGLAGVAAGTLVGRSRTAAAVAEPVVHLLRSIPPPALVPLFVALFQFGAPMQIATIACGVVWPVLISTMDGVRAADPAHLQVAAVYRLSRGQRLRFVVVPSAAPYIAAGLRISLPAALVLMVLAELVGTTGGIGHRLIFAQQSLDPPQMWAAVAVLGVVGYTLNAAFLAAERRLLAWHHHTGG
ncbi:ABC transporter permease [Nonomuraea sp. NPDC059023]|uniref:ABC transporter permease n=1 Tax=unclassified Nonomuraea TaxID=2593643 RepID=UPI0036C42146